MQDLWRPGGRAASPRRIGGGADIPRTLGGGGAVVSRKKGFKRVRSVDFQKKIYSLSIECLQESEEGRKKTFHDFVNWWRQLTST